MSMSQPGERGTGTPQDGIPAADAGRGAPPPAEGFGVTGEEPDVVPPADAAGAHADPPDDPPDRPRDDVPFRTPDPSELGRGSS